MAPKVEDARPLPSLVDHLAETDPTRAIFSVPKSKDLEDGFEDISIKTFANAVNRCARHIEGTLGRGEGFPTVAYMGPQDLVYAIMTVACAKTGYVPMFLSPRNSLEAHISLLERTDCDIFLLLPSFPLPIVKDILKTRQMRVVDIPGPQYWLVDNDGEEPYPYTKTLQKSESEPLLIFHTSGSTGLPKPIKHTHKLATVLHNYESLASVGQHTIFPDAGARRFYAPFPFFHAAGFLMGVLAPFYLNCTAVIGPSPPSAAVVNAVIAHGNVDASACPPTVLIDLARNPDHLKTLGHLEWVAFGGGPLPKDVGDRINTVTDVISIIGTTECGAMPFRSIDKDDWDFLSMSPAIPHEFRPVSDDLYELIFLRDPAAEKYQAVVFNVFPELQEFSLGDLYEKHPTKESLYRYKGRADDVIVYSTGEKVNPVDMEALIGGHPLVKGVLVAGQGRFQSSLLIEVVEPPAPNSAASETLIDQIWPTIKKANALAPSHARILRDKIIFASADKPMKRVAKGTVQRRQTVELYAPELDALYSSRANDTADGSDETPKAVVNGSVQASGADIVQDAVDSCTDINPSDITPDTDLFDVGLDSLQIATMAKHMNKALTQRGVKGSVEPQTIYAHHTMRMLTTAVEALIQGNGSQLVGASGLERMKILFDSFTGDIPITGRPQKPKTEGLVFVLTGSTGSLGCYILDTLTKSPHVSRVYCLNRGPGSVKRQEAALASKDLHPSLAKVEFLETNLAQPYFGLPRTVYKKLLNDVTNVIHNAWKVDFNQPVDSFLGNIQSVRRCIDFSVHSTFGAKVYFISSIGTVTGKKGGVPEAISHDWEDAQSAGYGQSKLVGENMLDVAAKEAGVPAVICRVGQIAGPTTHAGSWPKQEWLPSLIASSKHLGKLPATLGAADIVDWVPVDVLGKAIVELASSSDGENSDKPGAAVHHTVNRNTVHWKDLAPSVQEYLGGVELVSLEEWVDAVRQSASAGDLERNPAVKLLGFFEGLCQEEEGVLLDMTRTCKTSKTLANLGPVSDEWMGNWIAQWAL